MKLILFTAIILSSFLIDCNGFKILAVLPFGSKSHWAVGHAMVKTLVDAGHEATVLTPYPMKKFIKNYHEINIEEILEKYEQSKSIIDDEL